MQTAIGDWHREHGARMTEFAGYDMPLFYQGQGILEEHRLVREAVGMFDVSHMGELLVRGPKAAEILDIVLSNQPSRLLPGQAIYSLMCAHDGGTVDDLVVYRKAQNTFLLVVNAANRSSDFSWIKAQLAAIPDSAKVEDVSLETALIAVQGPRALQVLAPLVDQDLAMLASFQFVNASIAGIPAMISRTGYTGEDGFEVYLKAAEAMTLWGRLHQLGVPAVGLGARDSLRLEARLALYGHELSRTISPLEAGLTRFVRLEGKGASFIGRQALLRQRERGLDFRLAGLMLPAGAIPRHGYRVGHGTVTIGDVTSGGFSPTLKQGLALALLPTDYTRPGTELWVMIRGKRVAARVAATPFYRRK